MKESFPLPSWHASLKVDEYKRHTCKTATTQHKIKIVGIGIKLQDIPEIIISKMVKEPLEYEGSLNPSQYQLKSWIISTPYIRSTTPPVPVLQGFPLAFVVSRAIHSSALFGRLPWFLSSTASHSCTVKLTFWMFWAYWRLALIDLHQLSPIQALGARPSLGSPSASCMAAFN